MTEMQRNQITVLLLFLAVAAIVTIQRGVYGFPNDYAIFRASFWNLIAHRDLYVLRLDQARDYFKYSPTFALLFAPFALLPFVGGLLLWNVVNASSICLALNSLLGDEGSIAAQLLVLLPVLRSMQSSQSNALVAALIVFAFVCYERGWLWRGAGSIAVGTAIKIFPLAALTFALPRRDRWRAIALGALCTLALVGLPLLVLSASELAAQFRSWTALERTEATLVGSSAMVLIRDAGLTWPAWPIQLLACAILLAALAYRVRDWDDRGVRLQFLALVLVFCVVFNHRAERQSSVIAITGMVIWLLSRPRAKWRVALFAIIYLLVSVAGTEIVPDAIKGILTPEIRFTIPLTAGWLVILGELVFARDDRGLVAEIGEDDAGRL
jgi:hypothetical protein